MVGSVVGSYRVVRQIGEGGMGRVYLAEHTLIGKRAAVKVLLPQYSTNAEIVNRFFNEARASSILKHPSVVDVYDFGNLADGSAFIVMEYLEGESLSARLQRERRLQVDLLFDVGRQVAGALAAAHQRGIVHRDLKPDNIFLVVDADLRGGLRAKILDFGIAKLTDDPGAPTSAATRTGAIIGTPTYMSPEQCRGAGKVDHRTDVYALGCVIYEMATGRPPFVGEGPGDVIAAHMFQDPPSLNGILPENLAHAVARMLAKQPQDRFQNMSEVVAALSAGWAANASMNAPRPPNQPLPTVRLPTPVPTETHASATRFVSTTLGGASGQVESRADKSSAGVGRSATSRWVVATSTVAVGIALCAGVFLRVGGKDTSKAGSVPPSTRTTAPTIAQASPSASPPAAVALPRRITVQLDSQPQGADVFRAADGVFLGKTPLTQQYDESGGEAALLLKLHGYQDARTSVVLDHDVRHSVVLQRVISRRSHPTAKVPAPAEKRPSKNGVVDPFDN